MVVSFIKFALVGLFGTSVHYSVLYTLVELLGFEPVPASGCGALAGLIVNYVLNYKFTFNSSRQHVETFPKFALIGFVGMGFNLALMWALTPRFYYLYAQIFTTLLVLFWNFIANVIWTFEMEKTTGSLLVKHPGSGKNPMSMIGMIIAILLIRLATLGVYPLYDPSESRYAEMARKMLELGDWITPMIDYGVPFWGKPPLTIWLTAISMYVGGINEFAARFPSLLVSMGSAWMVFHLVKTRSGAENALTTVLILSSMAGIFVMAGAVAMDLCLSFGLTLALSAFWLSLHEDKTSWGYVFFIGLSIGLMAKGPIAIVLAGASIGLWTILTWRWRDVWRRIPWITGTCLMLCISVPWFLLAEQKTPGFLEYFFIGEHWKRFTESGWKGDLYGAGRARPFGMIWIYWLAAGFPWTFILLQKSMFALIRKKAGLLFRSADDWLLYCLLWMLAPLLFFTLAANYIWTYVLPCLPGAALLVNEWRVIDIGRKTGLALTQSERRSRSTLGACLLGMLTPIAFLGLVIYYNAAEADFYTSQKRLVDVYRELAAADERLIYPKEKICYSAQFYLHGKAVELIGDDALKNSLASPGHDYYVLRKNVLEALPEALKHRLAPVKSYGVHTLYHLVAEK